MGIYLGLEGGILRLAYFFFFLFGIFYEHIDALEHGVITGVEGKDIGYFGVGLHRFVQGIHFNMCHIGGKY